jgi:hypothetical protein
MDFEVGKGKEVYGWEMFIMWRLQQQGGGMCSEKNGSDV